MAGEFSIANVEAAARAAAKQAGTLRRIEDAFAPDPSMGMTLKQLQDKFDEAGHKVGDGYDNCEVCQGIAQMLPELIMQAMAPQEPGRNGFS